MFLSLLPSREVNEDNMIFRNVAAEGFEDGFKHVNIFGFSITSTKVFLLYLNFTFLL